MQHELTVRSRGIIMDKEARDVSTCIATAARKLGYHAENVSDYVDDPDRTNCLVRRYARFADEPILDRFVYENPNPDWVVLVEETIIKAVNFFHRTRPAQGVLVVNSQGRFGHMLPEHVARVQAGANRNWELIGMDVPQALRDLEDPACHQRLHDEEYSMPVNRGIGA